MENEKKIAKDASIVGSATMLSRILGYARDAVVASFFGAGLAADAFFVAFRISNLLRRLVGEGALTSSFIPVFTELLASRTKEEVRSFVSSFFLVFFILLVILAILGIVFADSLVVLMAPGFDEVEGKFALTVSLTKLMFPYMVFIGLMAIAMGVLNSLKHFTAPAISPVFFNISVILSVLILAPLLKEPVYAIAGGVLFGGALQFAIQLPAMKRRSMMPRPIFNLRDPAIRRVFLLMGPAILGVGVYQLNIIVAMRFASGLEEGSVSYLYYAGRLMELPLGVFAVAISTAILPSLSEFVVKGDYKSFRSSFSFAIRVSNFLAIPATVGLIVLSLPIIDLLFVRGEFTLEAAHKTSYALFFYALGVVPIAASRILISVFYSMKDTRTPVMIAIGVFFFHIIMCMLLIGPLTHGGLALAATLSACLNLICLAVVLRRRLGAFDELTSMFISFWKSTLASIIMGLTVYGIMNYIEWAGLSGSVKLISLSLVIVGGAVLYLVISRLLKVSEVTFLRQIIAEKVNKKSGPKMSK